MFDVKRRCKKIGGMTLVELMIAVAIVGLLATVASYNILSARNTAQKYVCIANLRQLDNSITLWSVDYTGRLPFVQMRNLVPTYIKSTPYCPLDTRKRGYFVIWRTTVKPRCNYNTETHILN